ncbi:MAG: hypothetical protein GKS03_07420 [Alphaproteobacteria bacterium]|nr:hypothetical protein [Alphaproteobacteria bacterium]
MRSLTLISTTAFFGLCLIASASAQNGPVPRSSLFVLEAGDRVEDAGVFTVAIGPSARTEAFEVVRRADGGRIVTSITTRSAEGASRVPGEGRWTYDANEHPVKAEGKTRYNGTSTDIEIIAALPIASITVRSGAVKRTIPAPCDPDCLIDFSPSALPMFTMTRLYDYDRGGIQSFTMVGQGLFSDSPLLGSRLQIEALGRQTIKAPEGADLEVSQFVVAPSLAARPVRGFAFNLWVDEAHRPLAFDMPGETRGIRSGFDFVVTEMPPVFD